MRYDLNDSEWSVIEPFAVARPAPEPRCRPASRGCARARSAGGKWREWDANE